MSTDIEADGPIPGPHSMLSFGSVAFRDDGERLGEFAANLLPLVGAAPHPRTAAWWEQHPEAFAAARVDPQDPAVAMQRYVEWLDLLPARVVFVGQPAGYDFAWIYWYLMRFCGRSPFGHSALDAKTYAMAILRRDYRDCVKRALPKEWLPDAPHEHVALADAREQAEIFVRMLRTNRGGEA